MKFKVKHNGKTVGTVTAPNIFNATDTATKRWGPGNYSITLVRQRSDEEE